MLPYIVSGLVTGAVYGLAAVGLTLTYKTSGIFNFAAGALATIAAYAFYEMFVQSGWSWEAAAAVTIFAIGPVMGLALERMAVRLEGTSLAHRVAATVGLLIAVQAIVVLHYGQLETRIVPTFLAEGDFALSDTRVTYSQLITVLFALISTALLWVFFRFARLGMAMRAVVDNPELVGLAGTSPTQVRRYAWIIGTMFAAACGVLFAPLLPLDPTRLTLLIVPAFAAAAIGAFTSLPLSFAGGLGIGVLAALSTKWFTTGILTGLPQALPFLVLFVVLIVFPRRWLVEHAPVEPRSRTTWTTPWQLQVGGGVALFVFLLFVPSFADIRIGDWTTALATVILFLSLGLLVRTSGQVSLGQVAFAAIGAAAFSHLSLDAISLPWIPALICAGLVAVPVGALLAIPAIRVAGLYLALATFGFAIFLAYMFYTQDIMFGSTGTGIEMPRPSFGRSDDAFYYVVLAIAVFMSLLVVALTHSRLGRLLRGMADSPTALSTSGVSVNVTRVLVFCISAFMAAIAGALIGSSQQNVSVETFPPLVSLTYLALIMIVVGREPWYAIMAGFALILPPAYISDADTSQWLQLLFGVSAMGVAMVPARFLGVPPIVSTTLDGIFRKPRAAAAEVPAEPVAVESIAPATSGTGLEVENLTVRFGGLVAVDGVALTAPTARITGLIGPNGAGKTTTFNACSGLNRPNEGHVLLDGHDVTRRGPAFRARRGLGRTFQKTEMLDSLTVWENVEMGAEGWHAGANPLDHVIAKPADRAAVRGRTADALELCRLTDLAHTPATVLSTGQRRLVELARCLAGPFHLLLLDEPTSGLDKAETEEFGRILKRVVTERGEGIMVVEHDMSFVMGVCDHIYVLDFGKLIFEGSPAEVRASELVRAAYLGDEKVEEEIA